MNDARLLELLAGTDRYPVDTRLPDAVPIPDIALHEIEWRIDMQTQERPEVATPAPPGRKNGWLIAAAAAIVAVVVVAAIWITGDDGSEESPDAAGVTTTVEITPTTAAPVTTVATTAPSEPSVPPLDVIEALDAAIVAGDWQAVLALYAEDATYTHIDDGFGYDAFRHGQQPGDYTIRTDIPFTSTVFRQGPGLFPGMTVPPLTGQYPNVEWDGEPGLTASDDLATLAMASYVAGVNGFYSCAPAGAETVVCDVVVDGDAFWEASPPVKDTFTVVDGLITHQLYDTT
ncbi:MAG: hypothetical protein ACR2OI_00050, partial [Acidimicrobiia bacterium]